MPDITIEYEQHGPLFFRKETPEPVRKIVAAAFESYPKQRLRFDFGDAATGESSSAENDVEGYIARSTGEVKVPILLATSRSTGGGLLPDHTIIRIWEAGTGNMLWQHPTYTPKYDWRNGKVVPLEKEGGGVGSYAVYAAPWNIAAMEVVSSFGTSGQAQRWLKKKQKYETK